MPVSPSSDAFRREAHALSAVGASLSEAQLSLPSPCPPWSIADLLCHVVVAVGRVGQAVSAAADGVPGPMVTAVGYYRHDHRFSPAANADRVDAAASLAARLRTAAAIAAELTAASERSLNLLESAGPEQEARTRHGDRMLLSDFAVTRVVELAVHGLDLAAGLGRQPWLTASAATVLEDLLIPGADATAVCAELGCDRIGLIARLTGRMPLSPADCALLDRHAVTRLALG